MRVDQPFPNSVSLSNLTDTFQLGPYKVEDGLQCDKYYSCDTSGKLTAKLCPDGFVFDIPGNSCNHPQRVQVQHGRF